MCECGCEMYLCLIVHKHKNKNQLKQLLQSCCGYNCIVADLVDLEVKSVGLKCKIVFFL